MMLGNLARCTFLHLRLLSLAIWWVSFGYVLNSVMSCISLQDTEKLHPKGLKGHLDPCRITQVLNFGNGSWALCSTSWMGEQQCNCSLFLY